MEKYIKIIFAGSPVNHLVACDENISLGDKIIVESSRGIELAKVVMLNATKEEQTENEEEIKFVSIAKDKDISTFETNKIEAVKIKEKVKELALKESLEMKIDEVFISLDKSKITIYFTAENRVDFRNLVKELASNLKSRIELKQVGARDEVRCMGGIGPCGKSCCCKDFLNDFDHVTIKMAKNQNLSLNPTKISGLCGRLMCCLAYENEHYAETNALMPKINSEVITPAGKGVVVYNDLLKREVTVKIGSENQTELKVFDLTEIKKI